MPREGVIEPKHHHGAYYRNHQAPEVEPRHTSRAERCEDPASDKGADDAEHDVEGQALPMPVEDHAAEPAGDGSEDDPAEDSHGILLMDRPQALYLSFRGPYAAPCTPCPA